jgi:uncharacterized protein (TIGR01777 family)
MAGTTSGTERLHVAVTGAGGLIGSALTQQLAADGHRVSRLVRRAAGPGEIGWDPIAGRLDPNDLDGLDAVVHLAGENVGVRWTTARKARIRDSRIQGTRVLSEALARIRGLPPVLVSASAIGIYGDRGDEILTESSAPGPREDFLAALGQEWENAAAPALAAGIRVVHPRFGVVLSPAGGALGKMLLPFRLGLGGRLGDGSQWMSWISIDDVVSALLHLVLNKTLSGPVNVTAPEPLRNRDFTRTLGRVLSRPTPLPVPSAALRLVLGEMADSTLLASARVLPERLLGSGYRFTLPDLETALRHIFRPDRRAILPP